MTINLSMPVTHELKPRITVIGVGGAGGNAVNNMITSHLEGVEFVVANTDAQVLTKSLSERRIQLGAGVTHGLGAGARPEIGRAAAEEAIDDILDQLQGSHMVFITAGMGGGTGTGAAPVIARAVRESGVLTVAVVTKPFQFEGARRMRLAEAGLDELQQYVDTLIVIPNQNLFRICNERTTFAEAFAMADQVLHMGVRGVTDLMVRPGLINLDFNDIRTVMSEMGKAMMGTGEAEGDRKAIEAAEAAISNPLLDEVSMKGARGVLINITGGMDMALFEVDEAANRIKEEVDADANIIFGSSFDENMDGRMRVSVVATGIESERDRAKRAAAAAAQSQAEQAAPPPPVTSGPAPFRFKPTVHKPQPFPAPPAPERRPAAADPRQHQASALAAPAEASHTGFVAPQPVEPGYQREQAQPVAPGQWGRQRPAEGEPGVRVQSLFEKVTLGLTRGRSQRPPMPPAAPQQEAQPRGEPVATAPVERTPTATAPGGTRTVERVPATAGDDEVYDIPTFLRR